MTRFSTRFKCGHDCSTAAGRSIYIPYTFLIRQWLQLLQVEVFQDSSTGRKITELESELADCRIRLAQAEEDNDNLDFELSQLKDGRSLLESSLDNSLSPIHALGYSDARLVSLTNGMSRVA